MKTTPSTDQQETYREQGFLVVPEFLDPDELASWRQAVDWAMANRGDKKLASEDAESADQRGAKKSDDEARYYESVFTQRINLWQTAQGVRVLVHDLEFSRFAGRLPTRHHHLARPR